MTPASAGSAKRRDTAGGSIAEGDNIAVRAADAPTLTSILDGLTDAQKRTLRAMSQRREFPGKETFSAPGAWSLSCVHPRMAEYCMVTQQTARSSKRRMAFYLTPLGQQIRTALLETEK